jgi:hypothetical protein
MVDTTDFPPYTCDTATCNPPFVNLGKDTSFYRIHYYLANRKNIKPYVKEDIQDGTIPSSSFYKTTQEEYGEVDAKIITLHQERAKAIFKLYKKKECERKRRYKRKRKSPENEFKFFLNRCGICHRLRPAVNLFWGELMCERCYFTPSRILFVMNRKFLDVEKLWEEGERVEEEAEEEEEEEIMVVEEEEEEEEEEEVCPPEEKVPTPPDFYYQPSLQLLSEAAVLVEKEGCEETDDLDRQLDELFGGDELGEMDCELLRTEDIDFDL